MGQKITAMFQSRSEAEAVQNELRSLGIVKDDDDTAGGGRSNRGHVYDKSHSSYREGTYSDHNDRGFWSDAGWDDDDDYYMPDEDRHVYEEGVHRGNTLLTVTVDDEMAQRAREVIERSNAFDVDAEASSWRSQGWNAPATAAATSGAASAGNRYYTRDTETSSTRYRSYRRDTAGNGPG